VEGLLLETPPLDVYAQMAFDENAAANCNGDFLLRVYNWRGGGVTFGYAQFFDEVVKTLPSGTAVTRRPTGGGIVLHGDDMTFSCMFPPQGTLAPIPGGPAARDTRQDTGQVIQQYRSDPIVQQWQAARTATMQLQNLGQSGSPADDVAMIFSFMRALDPNSTVREGEFATAQNTAGIPERVRNYYNQAARGTLLGEQQRREFVNTAGRLYTERSRVYNDHADSYRRQLRSMGVENPNEFVPVAMAPITEDRRRRERQNQPVEPNDVMEGVNSAIEQMIPGQPQRFRILRRRRR